MGEVVIKLAQLYIPSQTLLIALNRCLVNLAAMRSIAVMSEHFYEHGDVA